MKKLTVKKIEKQGLFLYACKKAYFEKVRPSNLESKDSEICKILISIVKTYVNEDKLDDFFNYHLESQYSIPLWAAHLSLDYGNVTEKQITLSLEIIERYSNTPLNKHLAEEEKEWLAQNKSFWISKIKNQ